MQALLRGEHNALQHSLDERMRVLLSWRFFEAYATRPMTWMLMSHLRSVHVPAEMGGAGPAAQRSHHLAAVIAALA
jgi:hypothetical protein